jgi:curved DNA-binding protein CbpA
MMQAAAQTFYEILEVPASASQEEIVRAFQRAKATYSGSSPALYSVFSKDEAEELLRLINEAYTVLSNATTRRAYDQQLFDTARKAAGGSQGALPAEEHHDGLHRINANDDSFNAIPSADTLESFQSQADRGASAYGNIAHVPRRMDLDDVSSGTVKKSGSSSKPAVATNPNLGRTRFSEFEKDSVVEKEIAEQDVFDGTFLQRIRIYKRVSLDQICEFSRVGRHYVVAIENNDFHALPAPVFVRGFVMQLARILDLDEKRVADSFIKLYKQSRGPN